MAKGAYVGVATEFPLYSEQIVSTSINGSNIGTFFTVSHGLYGFYDSGNTGTFTTNNAGVNSGVAQTTLTALSDTTISFSYSYSSEQNYDKFTLTVAGTTVENAVSGATTTKSYSGSVAKGQQIVFKYAKDGSVNKNDDKCTFSNMKVTETVKTQIGSETRSIAHKIKKGYVGVDGLARKIKKAYIGIGGVARPCWAGGELTYYGTATSLRVARYYVRSATVGNYALFAGEEKTYTSSDYGYTKSVDAYDASLIRTTPTDLSTLAYGKGAISIGDYALFGGGGQTSSGYYYYTTVDAYDTSLTKSNPTDLSAKRYRLATATVGNYALFAGGRTNGASAASSVVDSYDMSLTRTIPTALSVAKRYLSATSVGGYALFAGGLGHNNDSAYDTVDAYDVSLTRSIPTCLSVGRFQSCGASIGDYGLFIGGRLVNNRILTAVDAYDTSLTLNVLTDLAVGLHSCDSTNLGGYALFGLGLKTDTAKTGSKRVEAYDDCLTRTRLTDLSIERGLGAASTIGDYALFAGGLSTSSDPQATVEVYTIV